MSHEICYDLQNYLVQTKIQFACRPCLDIAVFLNVLLYSVSVTLNLRIPPKQSSEELLSLIKEVGKLGTKLADIFEQIKNKAHEEGFRDEEIKELLKNQLRGILTRNQIYWYLFEKDKYNLKNGLLYKQVTI